MKDKIERLKDELKKLERMVDMDNPSISDAMWQIECVVYEIQDRSRELENSQK